MTKVIRLNASPVTASQKLWEAMRQIFYADELAYILNSIHVTSFPQFSSEWIGTLSQRIKLLNQTGSSWYEVRPDIVSGMFSPVISHCAKYESINELLTSGREINGSAIVEMIHRLYENAVANARDMRLLKEKFELWLDNVSSYMVLLEESESDGWKALDVDENSVSELTGKLAVLEDALESAQDSILPDSFSKGGKIAKSYGMMLYKTLIGGHSVSYFTVAGVFISVGKIFYDAFSSYADVKKLTGEIASCKMQYTLSQQALAQTKTMLRFLQALKLKISKARNDLDGAITIWDEEKGFLDGLLLSYERGADPKQTSLVTETVFWETMTDVSRYFLEEDHQRYEFETIEL